MIKELETQILLTEKANQLLKEISFHTEEVKNKNKNNIIDIMKVIEEDMQEIVKYCIKLGIPNNSGYQNPSKKIYLFREEHYSIAFYIAYITKDENFEWYLGNYSSGISYEKCEGLFCTNHNFSNFKPTWSYGFLNNNLTYNDNSVVQHICSKWHELKDEIIRNLANIVAEHNSSNIKAATSELEKSMGNLIASDKEVSEMKKGEK